MTCRKNPRIHWFFDSLRNQNGGTLDGLRIVVIDFWQGQPERAANPLPIPAGVVHVPPKASVWQGPHRLTSKNYFAASNARNTAICLAHDGWIAFVDDLSVLMPGWLSSVREAMAAGYVVLGAYKKVLALTVENGTVVGYRDHPTGLDSRWGAGSDTAAVVINGGAMYGCSLAAPVKAFLRINGFDEDVDPMGGEDYIAGLMLQHARYESRYDRRMLTLESEEAHYEEEPFVRVIKGEPRSQSNASHVILDMVLKGGRHKAPNYFGPAGIVGLRKKILAGEPFPTACSPEHYWYNGQKLSEM